MSASPLVREAAALAAALVVHIALLAAPKPERPIEAPAAPPPPIDGLDIEIEDPAALDAPAAGMPAAPGSPTPADAPTTRGQADPIEEAPAPGAGDAAKSTTPSKAALQDTALEPAATRAAPEALSRGAVPPSVPPLEPLAKAPEAAARAPDGATEAPKGVEAPEPAADEAREVAAKPVEAPAETPGAVVERPADIPSPAADGPPSAAVGSPSAADRPPPAADGPPPAADGPPPVAERPSGDEYGGPPPGDGAVAPGLGAPVWTLPGVIPSAAPPRPAPTAAPASRPVDRDIAGKVLSGTLHSRDKSVGIEVPAAGLVATTLANVVRASPAPIDARATFEVKLGADGQVLGVRLVSASAGSGPTWDGIVDAAKGALAGRALQMGPGKEPVTVTVKVQSKVQYPSGSKKKPTPELVCAEELLEQVQQLLEDPSLLGPSRNPVGPAPVDVDEEERKRAFCIPLGLRVRGDLSDIGAHAVNVVSATFTVKREGERALPHEEILPIDTRVPWAPPDPKKTKKPAPPKKPKKKKKNR